MKKLAILFMFLLVSINGFTQESKALWFKAYEYQYIDENGTWSKWEKCKFNITLDMQKSLIVMHTSNKITCKIIFSSGEKKDVENGIIYDFYCRFDDNKEGLVLLKIDNGGHHQFYFDFNEKNKIICNVEELY